MQHSLTILYHDNKFTYKFVAKEDINDVTTCNFVFFFVDKIAASGGYSYVKKFQVSLLYIANRYQVFTRLVNVGSWQFADCLRGECQRKISDFESRCTGALEEKKEKEEEEEKEATIVFIRERARRGCKR